MSTPREQEQQTDLGETEKSVAALPNQQQEPEPSRDATVHLIWAERRGKHGTERRYINAPDGSLLHTDLESIVPILHTLVHSGWRKAVAEWMTPKGDHYERAGSVTLTPPKRTRSASPSAPRETPT